MVLSIKPTMAMLNLKEIKENATKTENIERFVMDYMSEYGLQVYLRNKKLLGSHRGVTVYFTDDVKFSWGTCATFLFYVYVFKFSFTNGCDMPLNQNCLLTKNISHLY